MPNTVLTKEIITNAKQKVDRYSTDAQQLFTQLQTTINNLTANNFIGSSSDGFNTFFTTKVTPALTTNLYGETGSLMEGIKSLLDSIEEQLIDTVDDQLGQHNQNLGTEDVNT